MLEPSRLYRWLQRVKKSRKNLSKTVLLRLTHKNSHCSLMRYLSVLKTNLSSAIYTYLGYSLFFRKINKIRFFSFKKEKKMSERLSFREMLDLTVRTVLSAGSALLAATVITGEFVPIPECVKMPLFSNFTKYFICLGASAHFAWACLGRKFSGQSNAAGGKFNKLI